MANVNHKENHLQVTGRGLEHILLSRPSEGVNPAWPQTSSLQNCEKINFVVETTRSVISCYHSCNKQLYSPGRLMTAKSAALSWDADAHGQLLTTYLHLPADTPLFPCKCAPLQVFLILMNDILMELIIPGQKSCQHKYLPFSLFTFL